MSLKTIENALHDIVHEVEGVFESTSKKVAQFLKPFAAQLEAQGKVILIDAAQSAVAVGEATPGSGEVKMLAALAAFAATTAKEGVPYLESEARALIEVALQNVKALLAPAPEPVADSAPAA